MDFFQQLRGLSICKYECTITIGDSVSQQPHYLPVRWPQVVPDSAAQKFLDQRRRGQESALQILDEDPDLQ